MGPESLKSSCTSLSPPQVVSPYKGPVNEGCWDGVMKECDAGKSALDGWVTESTFVRVRLKAS
jgi:hypothetical protein